MYSYDNTCTGTVTFHPEDTSGSYWIYVPDYWRNVTESDEEIVEDAPKKPPRPFPIFRQTDEDATTLLSQTYLKLGCKRCRSPPDFHVDNSPIVFAELGDKQ